MMVSEKKLSPGKRHSPRFVDAGTVLRSDVASVMIIRQRLQTDAHTSPECSDQRETKRRRLDDEQLRDLGQEFMARRIRRLYQLKEERQRMSLEEQYYRDNCSALAYDTWASDPTRQQNLTALSAEIDIDAIERKILGGTLERRKPSSPSKNPPSGTIRSPRTSSTRSPIKSPSKITSTNQSLFCLFDRYILADESTNRTLPIEIDVATETPASVLIASFSSDVAVTASTSTAVPEGSVERAAKQEAQVLARISELRRQGLWSASRMPLCVEPARNKAHWDYLLEEARWMHTDFQQERRSKRTIAKKLSSQIAKLTRERELNEERSEQRTVREARRVSLMIARMVREFWVNVDKVVDSRAQEMIEAKKRAAMDQHLDFIVGQADKLSTMVQQGLAAEAPPVADDDRDFRSSDLDSDDDEATIAREERRQRRGGRIEGELSCLKADADIDMDDLLSQLPKEYLENLERPFTPASKPSETSSEEEDDESEVEEEEAEESNKEEKEDEEPSGEALITKSSYVKLRSENSDERQQELSSIAEQALALQPKGYTLETTQVKTPIPFLLRGTLREYQHVGLDWLITLCEKNLNGILADEMGLGKTIQTIAVLAHLACEKAIWGPHLIVVPTSVLLNWEMELKKWCPAFKVLTYFGSQKERIEKRKGWSKANAFHVCITSYKIVTQDIRAFKARAWEYFILDEAQNIKNFKSQRWQLMLGVRARHRLLLTGTPLQNNLMELWSLMHFLMPAIFTSSVDFGDWFAKPLTGMLENGQEYNATLVQRLHKVLRPFILRRLKSEVEKQLPKKVEHLMTCPLSRRQRYLYDDFMSRRSTKENLRSGNALSVLNIVMQLRKCCNHPNLFEPRPVLSSLAMEPLHLTMPAMLIDLVEQDENPRNVSAIGWLSENQSTGRYAINRALIEEIEDSDPTPLLPRLDGFRFRKPLPNAKVNGVRKSVEKNTAGPVFSVEAEDLVESGLHKDGDFWLKADEESEPVPMHLHTDSGIRRIVTSALPGNQRSSSDAQCTRSALSPSKVIHLIRTSDGTRTISTVGDATNSVERNSAPAKVTLVKMIRTSSMNKPPPIRTTILIANSSDRSSSAKHIQPINDLKLAPGMTPPFQAKELVGSSGVPRVRRVNSDNSRQSPFTNGDVDLTASPVPRCSSEITSGSDPRSPSMDSITCPPQTKRLRLELSKPVDPLDRFLMDETRQFMEERHTEALSRLIFLSQSRAKGRRPLIANELLGLLWKEKMQLDERSLYQRSLNVWRDSVFTRFMISVPPVVVDGCRLNPSTGGIPAYLSQRLRSESESAEEYLKSLDGRMNQALTAQKISFPELRLIEYDCGKLQVLAQLLRQLYIDRHRCLIFTQMSRMLDVLQAFLSFHGYQYFRLDGTTPIEQRQSLMERFNADIRIFCFILSTRSGGLGVNLTGADTVIFYDSDWNPTMDAQAQDRCHRIGQTRDVHIYRLISERTIEENILRKASQKRRLGELAIDEAGFTPDYFRATTDLRDLFEGVASEMAPVPVIDRVELEQTMAKIEDEQDVVAARRARAETHTDRVDFEEQTAEMAPPTPDSDTVDARYQELLGQLKPIERYAINFLEATYKPDFEEELKETALLFEQKKDEWVKAQEAALKRDEEDEDQNEPLTFMAGFDEMVCMETMLDTQMPTWMPPSPPSSESGLFDVYVDGALECLYESELMTDDRLPSIVLDLPKFPTFNKPETEQQRIQSNNHSTVDEAIDSVRKSAKQAMLAVTEKRDTSSTGPPQSRTLFDSRNRQDLRKTLSPPPPFKEDEQYEGPEWSIIEDYALLMAITREQQMTYNLLTGKAGHVPNWDYVAGLINRISGHYRSPRQCSLRYQLAVLPREEGRLVAFDPVSKKARKVHLSQTEVVHMKRGRTTTAQQFEADGQKLFGARAAQRFRSLRAVAPYLAPFKRCTAHLSLIGRLPTLQERLPPFQDTRLASFGIRYSTVIQPLEQAEYRDERRSRQPVAESVARLEQPLSKRLPEHSPANESRAQLVPLRQPALASAGILPPPSAVRPPLPGTIGPLGSSSHSGGVQQISEGHLVSALVDHHQMQMNAASIRRQISNSSLSSSQNSQQSISFMVTQEGTQPSQSRMPYAGRPDGSTPYRAIVPQTGKPVRTPPSTPLPVGFAQSNLPTSSSGAQVYTGTMTAVRSSGEEVGQVQLMRPQLQPAIAPSNIRPKMTMGMGTQRVNRVILTTTSGAQGNAYLVPQGQPMRSGGQQRMVAQKRNAPLSSKASTSSQPVTTLMLQNPRGATMQQMRNMPRHQMPGTSQTTPGRIPSIGLLMSNARGEAPSQQIRIQQQTRGVNQPSPHLLVAQAQRQEALPPISLSTPLPLPPSPRPPPSSTNQP